MELAPGRMLGPYRLVERAGTGGMAEVWRAVQPSLDRIVAIKVLPRHLAAEPGYLERFRREARAISRLDHPNILGIHDFGEDDGYTYMVMPFLAGGTLARNLGRPWSVRAATRLLAQLAAALDYAHARGVIHRDVKPSNILIADDGRVVLGDFGIARMTAGTLSVSLVGGLLGTPAYMSPEQVQGIPASPASDQYSLGVIAYEMLTGRRPFEAETPMGAALAHVQQPLPPPRTINPAISPAVEAVLQTVLAKRPEDRFRNVSAFVNALTAAEPATVVTLAGPEPTQTLDRGAGPTVPPPPGGPPTATTWTPQPPPPPPPPRPGSHLLPVVGGLFAAGSLVLLAALYVAWPWPPDRAGDPTPTVPVVVVATGTTAPAVTPTPPPRTPTSPPATPTQTRQPPTPTPRPPTSTPAPPTPTRPPPTNTPVPLTATPVLRSQVFRETFDQGSGPMLARTTADYAYVGYDSQYVLKTTNPRYDFALLTWLPAAANNHANGGLLVDTQLVGPTDGRYVMLTCRGQIANRPGDNHYRAVVEPERGRVSIAVWANGQSRVIGPWGEHPAVNRGNGRNRIELRCIGPTISLAVNGQTVLVATDATFPQGGWGIGASTYSGREGNVEAWFDNLELRAP